MCRHIISCFRGCWVSQMLSLHSSEWPLTSRMGSQFPYEAEISHDLPSGEGGLNQASCLVQLVTGQSLSFVRHSCLPFCTPNIPHLNTKNLPSVSRGLQGSQAGRGGREVLHRADGMGLTESQGIDKQHTCRSMIRKLVLCHRKALANAIRRSSETASLPR